MPIYRLENQNKTNKVTPLIRRTFSDCGIKETKDLQPALAACPDAIQEIAPDTLIIAEEYSISKLKGSNRRIDLLGIDKDANVIVIELKRTEEGGEAELQAIRYAAMMATVTFDDVVEIYGEYLNKQEVLDKSEIDIDHSDEARHNLLKHLTWDEPNEERFAQQVKIVLASADFSTELTTSVIWLNDNGLDIRCVRLHPYSDSGYENLSGEDAEVLLDIQTIIPLPETSDYQVARKIKQQGEKRSRDQKKTRPRYDLHISGEHFYNLKGRDIIRRLIECSKRQPTVASSSVMDVLGGKFFEDEHLTESEIKNRLRNDKLTVQPYDRYFHEDHEIFYEDGGTYIFSNQWKVDDAVNAANKFKEQFPELDIDITVSSQSLGS